MKKVIIIPSPNPTVTSNNFGILSEAAKQNGFSVHAVESLKEAIHIGGKSDIYITSIPIHVVVLYGMGRKRTLFWVQGVGPEESLMRHNSKSRFNIASFIERSALRRAGFLALVGEPMKEHYEVKYNIELSGKYYVFPCFNTELNSASFDEPGKYRNNYFIYAGGLAVWQCFEKTLDIYKTVEGWGIPNTKLIVLTKDQQHAKEMIESKGIKNYNTGFTSPEKLPAILKDAKFGFVIREESPVNMVATPTKLSTYLSCGLIPIFGKSVETFRRLSDSMEYKVCWDDSLESYDRIKKFMTTKIDAQLVRKEYMEFFDNNYSRERHIEALGAIIKRMGQK